MKERNNRAEAALRRLLVALDLPGFQPSPADAGSVTIDLGGHRYRVNPIWVGEGHLADVRRHLHEPAWRKTPETIAVAHQFTEQATAWLTEHNTSWLDERGRARIVIPPGLAFVQGAARDLVEKDRGMRWSSSSGLLAQYLLNLGVTQSDGSRGCAIPSNIVIGAQLNVSTPQVSRILQVFDKEGWTRKEGSERGPGAQRVLIDAGALLSSWATWQANRHPPRLLGHATWQSARDFATERLVPVLPPHRWQLTGWLAADLLAPLVTDIPTITCYIDAKTYDYEGATLLSRAGIRPVHKGARVTMLRADPGQLTASWSTSKVSASTPLPTAAPIRVYADLLMAGARGEEAATHLRDTVIGF